MAIFTKATKKKETEKSTTMDDQFGIWMMDQILGNDTDKAIDVLKMVCANGANNQRHAIHFVRIGNLYLTKHLGAFNTQVIFETILKNIPEHKSEEYEETEKKPVKKNKAEEK